MQAWNIMVSDVDLGFLAKTRVLVVGDVMLDRYWFGDVERISPEAPVPVVAVRNTQDRLGGAANVAMNVRSLGGSCTLIGIVGEDNAGQELRDMTDSCGIETRLAVDSSAPTSVKQRIIARNQQLLRADFEETPHQDVSETLLVEIESCIKSHDVVVFSDYGKGALHHIDQMIDLVGAQEVPAMVDPKGSDFSRYSGAATVTPNLKEFETVCGIVEDDTDLAAKADRLLNRYNIGQILVTLSERGMSLFRRNEAPLHSPARSREVYDVSGAGDTVIAVMAMCRAGGLGPESALEIANSAAGVVVSKLGTATCTRDELRSAIRRDHSV